MPHRSPPALAAPSVSLAAVALLLLANGCAPTIPDCFAQDLVFGAEADDESVAELAIVDCVSGNVMVENTEVGELAMPYLSDVGGSLVVSGNVALSRVELPALVRVGGLLEISLNPVLAEVSLPVLEEVGDDLVVVENPELAVAELADALADVDVTGERVFE